MIADHLARAERHVAEGEAHIDRQLEVISELERAGNTKAAQSARELLVQFQDLQLTLIVDRDRLRRELAALERL